MIVAKFGGSGVTANNLHYVEKIVRNNPEIKYVVVSAVGKSCNADEKITDLLISYAESGEQSILSKIVDAYVAIKERYKLKTDLEKIIKSSLSRSRDFAYVVSRGEFFSALAVSELLDFPFLDTHNLVKFDFNARLNTEKSSVLLAKALSKMPRAVITGFYGSDPFGRTALFSRGGSDITGALVSDAVNAVIYENWTDVDGFLTANPQKVLNPKTIECMSYGQLGKLNRIGADVLHPMTVLPLIKKGIPINIRNIYNPAHPGTLISQVANKSGLLAVTSFEAVYTVFDKVVPSCRFEGLKFYHADTMTKTLTEKPSAEADCIFQTEAEYVQAVFYGKFDSSEITRKLSKIYFSSTGENTLNIITEPNQNAVQIIYDFFQQN